MFEDIRNANEEAVKINLGRIWDSNLYCKCDQCKRDVYTLALNKMKPKYTSSLSGSVYASVQTQDILYNIEVTRVILECCEIIGKNPKHGPNPENT